MAEERIAQIRIDGFLDPDKSLQIRCSCGGDQSFDEFAIFKYRRGQLKINFVVPGYKCNRCDKVTIKDARVAIQLNHIVDAGLVVLGERPGIDYERLKEMLAEEASDRIESG